MEAIFSDLNVTVTKAIVKDSAGTTYQINQINSTQLTKQEPIRWAWALGAFFLGSFAGSILTVWTKDISAISFLHTFGPMLAGGFAGYKGWKFPKTSYFISLRTSSGEVKAFHSKDQHWVQKVNNAILEAMTKAA